MRAGARSAPWREPPQAPHYRIRARLSARPTARKFAQIAFSLAGVRRSRSSCSKHAPPSSSANSAAMHWCVSCAHAKARCASRWPRRCGDATLEMQARWIVQIPLHRRSRARRADGGDLVLHGAWHGRRPVREAAEACADASAVALLAAGPSQGKRPEPRAPNATRTPTRRCGDRRQRHGRCASRVCACFARNQGAGARGRAAAHARRVRRPLLPQREQDRAVAVPERCRRRRIPARTPAITTCQSGPDRFIGAYLRIYGGTTWHWTGLADRLRVTDFARTLYGVGEDWPIELEDIEPYYERADELWGVSGDRLYMGRAAPRSVPAAARAANLSRHCASRAALRRSA